MVSEHGRSAVAHARVDADAGWETMPIPPDCERVPSADGVVGSLDAGREMMPIPPDCERVPGSAGAPGPDRETMPIPSDCERLPCNGGDACSVERAPCG